MGFVAELPVDHISRYQELAIAAHCAPAVLENAKTQYLD